MGVLITGLGLIGFLAPTRFIDGGVTGVSMLLSKVGAGPLPVWIVLLNLPFIWLGYRMIGASFALRSSIAIFGLAGSLALVPYPVVTADKLLAAVFGGSCIGAGIGLAMRGGAVLDGTEIVALLVSRNSSILRVGDVILLINTAIFAAAALLLGVEPALYSLLTYFAASRAVDFLLHGIEEYTSIVITTTNGEAVRDALVKGAGRSVTMFRARGGASGEEHDVIQCVVTRLEIGRVTEVVQQVDAGAFIVMNALSHVQGGVLPRRHMH